MGYEIDFHPAGSDSKSGDAITLRYGNLNGERNEQKVIVIDGGYPDAGEKVVAHIRKYYKTEIVDLVISTHPDADHIGGLSHIIETLTVKKLWMHLAWNHAEALEVEFKDGRITDKSLREKMRKLLDETHEIEKLAKRKNISVEEPFAGLKFDGGAIEVVGPSIEFYRELLPKFREMPATVEAKAGLLDTLAKAAVKAVEKVMTTITEAWDKDFLSDDGETSAENDSSVITKISIEGKIIFLTADAGIVALTEAADRMNITNGINNLRLIQIPHHGSKRNVGPSILNRLIGEIRNEDETLKSGGDFNAIASVAKEGAPKHPSNRVLNAFTRRGARVLLTQGQTKWYRKDAPAREDFSNVAPIGFLKTYQDEAED
jgi:beta-lactamase superfamily II metal-dependent hydrolase